MGLLQHGRSGRLVTLVARSLVGRAPTCALVLDDRRASGEHAVISWGDDGWQVRDLGSLNGTWVDGARLAAGERVAVGPEARLGFGVADDDWRLVDESEPGPAARDEATGEIIRPSAGMLALPTVADPRASLFVGDDGHWVIEIDGAVRRAIDQDTLTLDGRTWTLFVPSQLDPLPGTLKASGVVARGVGTIGLGFRVSADEEHVDLTVRWGDGGELPLPPRSSHYTLLTLARARLDDAGRGVADGEQGWLHAGELADMLGFTAERLNIEIFRARSLLAKAGVVDAPRLIERRPLGRQLRIGVARLDISRA